ncbi:YchJ family protein [Rhodoblastus sp. 17X3]|uniref:YchJ family protein n=1 Tax=Rhodoblastus sp. 17X3 TaxID=3047026 RepID=UPI0024B85082|nr:YchJ family protein [Rhodoblastus sp. 17X3]MDI9849336.1 YchJ family protein [Rhodoblastus sp. 17X3]
MTEQTCPCRALAQDKLAFADCCGPYLARTKFPPTAEALMRSRYSAFAQGDVDYLFDTLADDQRTDFDRAATSDWAKKSEWLGLDILATEQGQEGDQTGVVSFAAHFNRDGKKLTHKERSLFGRDGEGRWRFARELPMKGETVVRGAQPGRNDPCPCGSGKKYKKCCGAAA